MCIDAVLCIDVWIDVCMQSVYLQAGHRSKDISNLAYVPYAVHLSLTSDLRF